MTMTEEAAKKTRCHKTFEGETAAQHAGFRCDCIASACMAWRWKYEYREGSSLADFGPGWVLMPSEMDWVKKTDTGFCGLAGKP